MFTPSARERYVQSRMGSTRVYAQSKDLPQQLVESVQNSPGVQDPQRLNDPRTKVTRPSCDETAEEYTGIDKDGRIACCPRRRPGCKSNVTAENNLHVALVSIIQNLISPYQHL